MFIQVKMATFTQVCCSKSTKWTIIKLFAVFVVLVSVISTSDGKDYCDKKFDKCICTNKSVECHNETKLIDNLYNLYPMIKDHVISIIITGSTFEHMPQNFFGSCHDAPDLVLNELTFVDLSSNKIKSIQGKTFHCMPNLKTLILKDNQWQIDRNEQQIGYFTSMTKLTHLDLTDTFEDVWDGTIHVSKLSKIFYETDMTSLEQLDLGYNEFNSLSLRSANSLCELTSLKRLNLAHNNFSEPSMPSKQECLPKLELLDLSSNKIDALTTEFMTEIDVIYQKYNNLVRVELDNNPFNCNCWFKETWKWLNSTKVPVNRHELKCAAGYHSSYIGRKVLDLTLDDLLCKTLAPQPGHVAAKVVTGIIFAIIGIALVAFMIVNRVKLRQCLRNWKKKVPSVKFRSHQGYSSVHEVAVI